MRNVLEWLLTILVAAYCFFMGVLLLLFLFDLIF